MTTHAEAIEPATGLAPLDQPTPFLHTLTGQTPWWIVSTLFHVLIIVLAGLVSMAIELPREDPTIIITQPWLQAPDMQQVVLPKVEPSTLAGTTDTPPTDPTSKVYSPVTVFADIKEFTLGNHWEADTPDRENTHSLPGDENAHELFLLAQDYDGKAGGGGTHGDTFADVFIGMDGGSSPGKGGGRGGGDGTGFGNDIGDGKTPFGHRGAGGRINMALRNGGSYKTEDAVGKALHWLAYHQETDGHWDTVKFGSTQKTDTAMTGMALLAFVGSGHTERTGLYKDNVIRAVNWLKSKQQPSGLNLDPTDAGAHRGIGYPTAIATLAIVEAAAMGNNPETRNAAQKAIDYCQQHQCEDGYDKLGWRYNPKQPGDTSVTGWFVMALKSAMIARMKVDQEAIKGAIKFIDSVEVKEAGGDASYGGISHYAYQPGNEHASSGHRLSAIGNLIRIFTAVPIDNVRASVEAFVNKGGAPEWGANGEKVDMYYWYYGSLCTFQTDGAVWDRWNTGLVKALTENQCKAGDDTGSWPIVGDFSSEWGRVGQTALGCLSMEVYYRYDKLKHAK